MAPGFKSIKTAYDLQGKDLSNTVEVELEDDLKVKLVHKKNSNELVANLDGHKWEASYNFQSKDFAFEFKRDVHPGELKVVQKISNHNWSAIPSPHIQLSTRMVKSDSIKDRLKLSYDFSTSIAGVEETVWLNDKRHKLKFVADNKTNMDGAVFSLKTKTDSKLLKSAGLRFNTQAGATVVVKSHPFDDLKAKAHINLQTNEVAAEFEYKPDAIDNTEITLSTNVPYTGDRRFHPTAVVGMKYKF